ncbi:MAG TPA: sigma-70 family RNA polymerase sigma factor [Planctomycetota bacterium]|jgi:RNA polymerase sigma-70 factor (ECF subfamily)|nr:sigma-70 family RNA polymerase sigma factor [Planctomycetota bacterium]
MQASGIGDPEPDSGADTHGLAIQVRSGDLARFRELYERVAPSLYAWARVRSSPGQGFAIEADDLLQETWTRALEGIANFDDTRASFRSWIFGIAKNVAYEAWRSKSVTPEGIRGPTPSRANALDSWPDVQTSIRSRLARDESVQRFLEHVAGFDPVDRMLLVHCGMEGSECSFVATRIGITADAATKRWQRLRARLGQQPFAALLEL